MKFLWASHDVRGVGECRELGEVTRATLPHSKDNVIFGVRSIDRRGHKSLGRCAATVQSARCRGIRGSAAHAFGAVDGESPSK